MPCERPIIGREFMFEGAAFQRGEQGVDVREKNVGRPRELHRKTGVEHVGRGHALMDEARLGPDEFGEMGQKGDDVMMRDLLDRVDPRHVEGDMAGLFPDRLGGLFRDDADFGQRVAGMRLDLEPDAKAGLRLPEGGHFGTGIAGDHAGSLCQGGGGGASCHRACLAPRSIFKRSGDRFASGKCDKTKT